MAVKEVTLFGNPILRKKCQAVTDFKTLGSVIQDMLDTLYEMEGIGLAANQIGISRRVAVFDVQDELGPKVLINPEVVEQTGEWEFEEGCLSIPERYWPILRPAFVRVKALDLDGKEIELVGDGLIGRVLQHEVDHLDGLLLLDRLPKRVRKKALKDLRNEALGLE